MADTTFLNYSIISDFLLPFLLVFFIVFAVLERTKLFGADKKQINALIAFVIGLIFSGAIYPKIVVGNLILFLTVTIVAVFVILLIWGFVFGESKTKLEKGLMLGLGVIATVVFIGAVIWATGLYANIGTFLSGGTGSAVITNVIFLVVIGVALALVMIPNKK
jgi:hypothetical protein